MTTSSKSRVAITGATGLVGTALGDALRSLGHHVIPISRRPVPYGVVWSPNGRELPIDRLAGVETVIHLAGENLTSGRWTASRKQRLRESRVATTRWFAEALAQLRPLPRVLISASAVGIYGDRGDESLTEASSHGQDFLARLATDWEAAADPARQAGMRVVHPRFGMILSRQGGALGRLRPFFRLGLGGPLGSGNQWMSWIAIDDVIGGIVHAMNIESLAGPVNFTAPHPVRNADFARALGRALHRPALVPVPAIALRVALGEMAQATILASQRVMPVALEANGYRIQQDEIGAALRQVLGVPGRRHR